MRCEVCGHQIAGKPHRVIIEGAKMTTCANCSKLGSAYWEPQPRAFEHMGTTKLGTSVRSVRTRRRTPASLSEDLVPVENFGSLIREGREKLGLSHEDLGRKIREKVSVIKKIESERMMPDRNLAARLEHALGVRLLVPLVEPKISLPPSLPDKGVTLGEIVHLKNRRRRPKNEVHHS